WKRLCSENAMVRILEGGKKMVGKNEDFYDEEILSGLSNDWQKGNRAIQSIFGKMRVKTGDVFLLWRIKKLVEEEKVEINGDTTKNWKDFDVKLKAAAPEAVETNNPEI
ncbi:MAG: DUF3658 domain-containing protein, partial [Flavisolibacter sp.]